MESNPISIRCSSLDTLWLCPPSVLADGVRVSANVPAAATGKACHEMAAAYADKGEYDLDAAAEHNMLDDAQVNEAGILIHYAVKSWDELKRFFTNPMVEGALEGPILKAGGKEYKITGTIDVCSPAGGSKAIFIDWKSGYIDDGYYQQMAGYAYLLWEYMGRPEDASITGVVVFLRHRYYRVIKYDAVMLSQWEHDLQHNVLGKPDQYRPGNQCVFCDLSSVCEARQKIVTSCIADIMGESADKPGDPGWLERARNVLGQINETNKNEPSVGELLDDMMFRIKVCRQATESARDFIRDTIRRVGPIPIGEGAALTLRAVEVESADTVRAVVVLRNYLSDRQIYDACKISLPKLYTINKKQNKGDNELLHQKLADAGALTVNVQHRLEQVVVGEETPPEEQGEENANGQGQSIA